MDLGLPSGRAWRLALDPSSAARLSRTNLDLLPRGGLKDGATVIDAGANNGDWAGELLRFCAAGMLVCVEPHPELAQGLRRRFADRSVVRIVEAALGRATAMAELHVAANPQLHSLRLPGKGMTELFPEHFKVESATQVAVRTLDEIAREIPAIGLLKIDVQGSERELLAGAADTLRKTDHVILEANFVPHYEGEAGFFELDALMRGHGFELSNYSKPKGGRQQALFADFLYFRKDR
jgi:FkbM family methyltransferase